LTIGELAVEFRPSLKLRLKVSFMLIETSALPVSSEVGGEQIERCASGDPTRVA